MVSKIILGTVQLGLNYGVNNKSGKVSEEKAIEILRTAYENGIRVLDTAEVYGSSHSVIGSFHKKLPECKFLISTKIPKNLDNACISSVVEKYCNDLNVDNIEYLLFHSFESYEKNEKIKLELEGLKKKNIISKIGVSVYTNEEALICINDNLIDSIQIPYNLLDNSYSRGPVLVKAKEMNKILHTRSAFLQGLFFMNPTTVHSAYATLQPYISKLINICQSLEISMNDLALAYCFSKPQIDNVLIGVDSTDQLLRNFSSLTYKLSETTISEIENIHVKELEWLNPSKWEKIQ